MRSASHGEKRFPFLRGFLVLLLSGPALAGQDESSQPVVREIRMTVRKYEYQPNVVRVKQGERLRILLTALDRKHGFQIKELGIKTDVEKGKETVVEFVAAQSGEFQFKCSVFCGLGHGRVKGRLIVEPSEPLRGTQ